ncbi:MAG: sigma-70 family RNA polymerase sigma factor [Pirellulales bacterium]|nr:sigma-70 family RNA polymerase sigma factor [Pirellulales bacterium]
MHSTLLERIAAGDPDALKECIDDYGALVWSLARRHLNRHSDAEDAVQEVFIEIWRNAGRFDPAIASEATFITMISRRRLIDRQRKQRRSIVTQTIVEEPAADSRAGQDQVDIQESAERIRFFMDRLRTEERRVLELGLLEGLTQSEIAKVADIPLGTVKTHARRGLMRLRELLGADLNPNSAEGMQ